MATETPTKPLGQPIEGEDRDATVRCPAGHSYGLYFYGVRNDVCMWCERVKAKAGNRDAQKRLARLNDLRQKSKRAAQLAAARAAQPTSSAGPQGARRRGLLL